MSSALRVALACTDPHVASTCSGVLQGFATVRALDLEEPPEQADFDVLVVDVAVSLREGISLFVRCRQRFPLVPIVIVAPAMQATIAVELVKCGADDVCLEPFEQVLRRKVQRALTRREGTVLELAELVPLRSKPPDGVNRRKCFRAPVPLSTPAWVSVHVPPSAPVMLRVDDISVESQGFPGGLGLFADRAVAAGLPLGAWQQGQPMRVLVHLPDGGQPIACMGRTVGGPRPGPERSVRIGIVYTPADARARVRIERFWVACQHAALHGQEAPSSRRR
jgi:CheY-like chemotaxis protein